METLFVTMEMFGAEPNDQIVVQLSTSDGHIIAQRRITITVNRRKRGFSTPRGFAIKSSPGRVAPLRQMSKFLERACWNLVF